MWVLGLNEGHNASAALLKDGKIAFAVQEERLLGKKNFSGYPQKSIDLALKTAGITAEELSIVSFSNIRPWFTPELHEGLEGRWAQKAPVGLSILSPIQSFVWATFGRLETWMGYYWPSGLEITARIKNPFKSRIISHYEDLRRTQVRMHLGIQDDKLAAFDHHACHAAAPAFVWPGNRSKSLLVMTLDGQGDGLCATVSSVSSGILSRIAATENHYSIGLVYYGITEALGMKPLEDEYKVMGLAPYGSGQAGEEVAKLIGRIFHVESSALEFTSPHYVDYALIRILSTLLSHRFRFDYLAYGVQTATERLVTQWVENATRHTELHDLGLSGGVFMNVKLNMMLMELPEVESIYAFPSCGDESNALGAAALAYQSVCRQEGREFYLQPLQNVYLGPEYDEVEIETALTENASSTSISVERCGDIEGIVSDLLSKGNIVARFFGPLEFGARALGNRSILANPSDPRILRELNFKIKNRDFWMPFAPTILWERHSDYIINPKKVRSPFMTLAFRTTKLAQKELSAALHPFDSTTRPQLLEEGHNESYYKIIRKFEDRTGIGAVLNTSFNLHGMPIVATPRDALWTLENSGLEYLALGPYLITKK